MIGPRFLPVAVSAVALVLLGSSAPLSAQDAASAGPAPQTIETPNPAADEGVAEERAELIVDALRIRSRVCLGSLGAPESDCQTTESGWEATRRLLQADGPARLEYVSFAILGSEGRQAADGFEAIIGRLFERADGQIVELRLIEQGQPVKLDAGASGWILDDFTSLAIDASTLHACAEAGDVPCESLSLLLKEEELSGVLGASEADDVGTTWGLELHSGDAHVQTGSVRIDASGAIHLEATFTAIHDEEATTIATDVTLSFTRERS